MIRLAILALSLSTLASAGSFTLSGWKVVSSANLTTKNDIDVTSRHFDTSKWYTLNSSKGTLMSVLIQNGVYNETQLFYSTNLQIVDTQQFRVPWFYRNEFTLNKSSTASPQQYALKTNGITSRADIWLNGKKIVDKEKQAGAYTGLEYNVTDHLRLGGHKEVLVIKVYPTDYDRDFALGFVDWNPYVWTGPISLGNIRIRTVQNLDGPPDTIVMGLPVTQNFKGACHITCVIRDPTGIQHFNETGNFTFLGNDHEHARLE